MSRSSPTRPRVLCYGKYTNLLTSRSLLLKEIGCDVDIAVRETEFQSCFDKRPEYALILICHTVATEERISIERQCQAQGKNTVVYSLEALMDPEELTLRVSELLDSAV